MAVAGARSGCRVTCRFACPNPCEDSRSGGGVSQADRRRQRIGAALPGDPLVAPHVVVIPDWRGEGTSPAQRSSRRAVARRGFRGLDSLRPPHCLAGRPPARKAGRSYSPHTPGLGSSPPSLSGVRASPRRVSRPSQVSGGLRPVGHVARGLMPHAHPVCPGSQPGIVTPRPRLEGAARVFPEQNAEALGYPSGWTVRGPAPSPDGPHWQALRASRLSWLSSSRPPFSFGQSPGLEIGPVRLIAQIGGPHASRVARASQPFAPRAGFAPASHHHGLLAWRRRVPVAPVLGVTPSDRTPGLSPLHGKRPLAGRASVDPDERLSTHPALRAAPRSAWRVMGRPVRGAPPR
ncbi:MAG: hypothetical protein KatS3mg108_2558 [Isosphaeraceae bacterium]|nr:MAG: hypothetical protein KatS3mg108_2558 [Isosphaeraceae bacterium]